MKNQATRIAALLLCLCLTAAAIEKEPPSTYKERRTRLAESLNGGALILFASPEEDLVEYRQEDNFYYLTGFDEPGAVLIIDASESPHREVLFIPRRDPDQEKWTGPKLGPGADAEKETGFDTVLPASDLESTARRLNSGKAIYGLPTGFSRIRELTDTRSVADASDAIAGLRQVKSASEIGLMEKAIEITMKAHDAAARAISPGVMEYEVEAVIEYEFRRNGAERPGFPSIVGSGPFSTILHYDKSSRRMEAGELVVVDIGAEYGGYSADITRTYPVSGKFTARQREVYQIVLDAQKAAIAQVKPGATLRQIHQAAMGHIRSKGYAEYFIHGTSHFIGLHVHDVGDTSRPLEPGMMLTVEPGIYIPAENLGVRIEDDLVVTEAGHVVLSNFPKEAAAVEARMQ